MKAPGATQFLKKVASHTGDLRCGVKSPGPLPRRKKWTGAEFEWRQYATHGLT
jgi:hypothetical protein